jgi:hypothetical protein
MKALSLLLVLSLHSAEPKAPVPFHPHFNKKIEISLPKKGLTMKLSHLTATFDRKGFEGMQPGKGWHLANGHLEFNTPLQIGGETFEPGNYTLKARKLDSKEWELVLDEDASFSAEFSAKAKGLKGEFKAGCPVVEHLHLDIQPSGSKEKTMLYLEARFDQYLIRSTIVIP